MPRAGFWWIYLLERADGSWYTGISTDPRRRFEQHRSGKGAKANKVSVPRRLVTLEPIGAYADALRREAQIKRLSKARKRLYAADPGSLPPPSPRPLRSPKTRQKKKRPGPAQVIL
jgi:predicted GIY-YIG superfamily endonuclease